MSSLKKMIHSCVAIMEGRAPEHCTEIAEAEQFLRALEYQTGTKADAANPATFTNRLAILNLAAGCDDLFNLGMPHAPGAFFFGAKVNPASFGIHGHGSASVGVAGRGLTIGEAFESCMGETAEFLSFIERNNDPLALSSRSAVGYPQQIGDWIKGGLGIRSDGDLEALEQINVRSLHSDKTMALPLDLILRRGAHRSKAARAAHSNGVAAGVTLSAAITSGVLELIERDAMVLWWHGGNEAGTITNGAIWGAEFLRVISNCRQGSDRDCWFLEITSDIPVPVVAAFSSREDGTAVISGYAADPDPLRAATRALLEMCQMELAQQISTDKQSYLPESKLSALDRIWIEREQHLSLDNFPKLRKATTIDRPPDDMRYENSAQLIDAISAAGFEGYYVDLTRPETGVPAVRVVVPGLQGTDPDWRTARLLETARRNNLRLQDGYKTPTPF